MNEVNTSQTILVVDDEEGILRLCSRLLGKAGFKVHVCSEPQAAVAHLEREAVHLLLVDIRMPNLDGFALLDLARRKQPDLAVVVMTGFGTVETAIEALSRGANGLVLKPFSSTELVHSVRHALQENQQKQDVLRLQTLRPLFAITESLFTETNPERLLELLVETVCGHLKCSQAGVYRPATGQGGYELAAGRGGLPPQLDNGTSGSIVSRAATWKIPLQVNLDGRGEPELQAQLEREGIKSMLAAPLRPAGGAGDDGPVLTAARLVGEELFLESDLEIFAILSRQAAVALENARLHEELRSYIRQVEESQRALVQAEKIAIAGRLTASIAHEINNPLQSVQNCLHLAGRKELPGADRDSYLEMAESELERLMNTVQRMLEYYRPGVMNRQNVDLNRLAQRVLKLMENQFQARNVVVQTRLASQPPLALAVQDQIQQVLLNLILNALEAMPEGGKLVVETITRKKAVELSVEDSGPGVPLDQRNTIFEPFVSSKEGGTGLGLAVSYGIAAAHGGSLELVQGRGKGACFRMVLPREGS